MQSAASSSSSASSTSSCSSSSIWSTLDIKPLKPYDTLNVDEKMEICANYQATVTDQEGSYFASRHDYPVAQAKLAMTLSKMAVQRQENTAHIANQAVRWAFQALSHSDESYASLFIRDHVLICRRTREACTTLVNAGLFNQPNSSDLFYLITLRINELSSPKQKLLGSYSSFSPYMIKFIEGVKNFINTAAREGSLHLIKYINDLANRYEKNPELFTTKMNALLKDVTPENKLALCGHMGREKMAEQSLTFFHPGLVPLLMSYDLITHYFQMITLAYKSAMRETPTSSLSSTLGCHPEQSEGSSRKFHNK